MFGEEDRQKANEIITNVRKIFAENLDKVQWIDEKSKLEARTKLNKITQKVGYPDFLNNKTKLNERFVQLYFTLNKTLLCYFQLYRFFYVRNGIF